ncbi:MAG: YceI family protein, partial [Acidimicrobiales bacterium]
SGTPTSAAASGTPTTASAAPATGGGLTGRWTIGRSSTAGYRVREKLARLPATSDAVGRTSAITGSIQLDRPGSQLVVASGAQFEVDVSQLRSDESQRDSRVRTMGLESNRFPKATFLSTGAIEFPASAESGAAVKTDVTGDLTIHGVTKRVTIPLDTQINSGRIEVVGSLTFPFSDFGMSPPSIAGIVTVESNATLEFQLFFDKA